MRFEKPLVLLRLVSWGRRFCKLIWRKNKLLPLKRSAQMCLQNVRRLTHRSMYFNLYYILTILTLRSIKKCPQVGDLKSQVGDLLKKLTVLCPQIGVLYSQVRT